VDEELHARLVAAALAQPPPPPELGAREDAVRRDEQVEHAAQLAPARAAVEVARRALGARRRRREQRGERVVGDGALVAARVVVGVAVVPLALDAHLGADRRARPARGRAVAHARLPPAVLGRLGPPVEPEVDLVVPGRHVAIRRIYITAAAGSAAILGPRVPHQGGMCGAELHACTTSSAAPARDLGRPHKAA